jgi:RNA 2',3'-cyclic 3'-phosphodiesterase
VPDTTLRLFFALWPDPETRAALGALARDVARETGGRAVAVDNVHLTLAFLGEQPADIVPNLCASAVVVEFAPFRLTLDEVGCFAKTGVAWLGAGATPRELIALQAALAHTLVRLGIALDPRPFAPHLTLSRRIEGTVQRRLPQPVVWNVASFALVASELDRSGARYRVVDAWPARGGP